MKKKLLSSVLAIAMILSILPTFAFAGSIEYTEGEDDYYKVISKKDYDLAPGVVESEIVLNNAEQTHRQVAHVVEVDIDNPYTKVIPSYKGMVPQAGKYGVQIMSQQAAYAEANGYGNVVAAMNLSLSWYNSDYYLEHPELVGEPLAYMILDGVQYTNSNGQTSGAQTCLVINFDEKDGVARPADIPKTEIRSTSSAITGWEEQVIPANFGFLVKDGVNQYGVDNNANNGASRSFVGIKANGDIVMVMNDGRQSPYSAGFTNYEMAEFMISLGCVQAVNGDGGGSSAFLSQRPGEELKINCSPSDGAERPTTHGILVISTAPADGQFARATITADHDYYTPGSTVEFSALGTDLVGNVAEIPADATWQLADPSMGTIENGVFVSNGKTGTVTAQMVYDGNIVGEGSVKIVIPDGFAFSQSVMTVPFDKEVTIGLTATINGGLHEVVLNSSDVTITTTNENLGTFNGFQFTSVSAENAPADLTSTLTATLICADLKATASLSLGKGSEVLFDFENASDVDEWNIADVNGNDAGFVQELSYATAQDGRVHDGEGSMRVYMNPLSAPGISNGGYGQSDLFLDKGVVVENAKSIGFWAYIPDEYEHCWIRVLYWYDSDGNGTFEKKNTVTVINQPEVYNTWDDSAWKYFSVDVSAYSKVLIPGLDCKDKIAYNASKNDANNFRFIEFMFPHTNTNDLWKTYGTINGPYTVYVDNITADFSDAVDDREEPTFTKVELAGLDTGIPLEKYNTVTTTSNALTVTATVTENTAKANATGLDESSVKAYVDGVEVDASYSNGRIAIKDIAVANGVHRVKFEASDMMGNKAVVVRLINVQSGVEASTVQVVPQKESLDKLYGGSVYWMDVKATDIETIQSVEAKIDLNSVNHWELDHMILADGFSAEYSVDAETNTAAITITRTGKNTQTGEVVLASLPIRVIYYDTDIHIEGYDAQTFWNEYGFWPQDVKVDVDMGKITYVNGYTSSVLNAFSNKEFSVATEMYTAFQDSVFKAERGTAHVHTPEPMADKAGTCGSAGYTGRTYCAVCDSVVDWGEEVAAAGHSFTVEGDGLYTCEGCGQMFYYVNSEAQKGWTEIEGHTYYFDEDGQAVNGEATVDGITYNFADYKLTAPALKHDGVALIGFWAGEQLRDGWKTLNGKTYFFKGIYANVGVAKVALSTDLGYRWYIFDDQGVFQEDLNGVHFWNDNVYYAVNGEAVYAGLVQDNDGSLYYINSKCMAVKNCTYAIGESKANGLVPAGIYEFGADGKMLNVPAETPDPDPGETPDPGEPEVPVVKNGLVTDEDGAIRFYKDGVAQYAGLVQDADGNLYYINSSKKAVTNCKYGIGESKTNGLVPAGVYEFDADGKMLNPPSTNPEQPPVEPEDPDTPVVPPVDPDPEQPDVPAVKNGLVTDEDGAIRYYVDGVAQYAGVVQDADGNLYYINSTKKAVKDCTYSIGGGKTNGLIPAGIYKFGADGKMIDPPTAAPDPGPTPDPDPDPTPDPEVKNGLMKDADGAIRYYEDGVAQYAGVVQDADGNLYYINSTKKAVTNCKYGISAARTNGLIEPGFYNFDSDGKMIR